MNALFVFLGGGLGCLTRYSIDNLFFKLMKADFLFPTILVNIIGCFLIGFLFCLFLEKVNLPDYYKLFLTAGFCGGISTFSKFSLDIIKLFWSGKIFTMLLYVILTFVLCICATIFGMYLQKSL